MKKIQYGKEENASRHWGEFVAWHNEPLPWALCGGRSANSEAIRHKESVEAYFLLDFLFLFYQEKRKETTTKHHFYFT